ncbi:MAG: glycosyltransferase [Methanobacteriota archaeon]
MLSTDEKIKRVGKADIAVIVSSRNNAPTIGFVLHQVAQGLRTFFPDKKSVIINVDGFSRDGCANVTRVIKLPVKKIVVRDVKCNGVGGKGAGVHTGMRIASKLGAKAVALVDSDLRSINPEWIKLLLGPILEGHSEFVSPYYHRYKYDGTITNFIGYPMVRSLFGKRLRQPIGGDTGFSGNFCKKVLHHKLWARPETAQFGIDFFLTGVALGEQLNVSEAVLGVKVHDVKDPSKHLAPMFRQVMGSILNIIEGYDDVWMKISGSEDLHRHRGSIRFSSSEPFDVDTNSMINSFLGGRAKHMNTLKSILPKDLYRDVASIPTMAEEFIFDAELWTNVIYHLIPAYFSTPAEKKEDILDIVRHMWMGRVAYFTIESKDLNDREAEHLIEEQSLIFEENKQLLVDLYRKARQ